jgi:hypothetical protein
MSSSVSGIGADVPVVPTTGYVERDFSNVDVLGDLLQEIDAESAEQMPPAKKLRSIAAPDFMDTVTPEVVRGIVDQVSWSMRRYLYSLEAISDRCYDAAGPCLQAQINRYIDDLNDAFNAEAATTQTPSVVTLIAPDEALVRVGGSGRPVGPLSDSVGTRVL